MKCPFCKQDDDSVIDTRSDSDGLAIRRRRKCNLCGRRYTTHERLEDGPLKVIKKNGRSEPFQRDKIFSGLTRALRKRPVNPEQIEALINEIERDIFATHDREIYSHIIGDTTLKHLYPIDKVAYVRFASVYRDFQEVNEFITEIKRFDKSKTSERKTPLAPPQ
jgi:transcriptional repressor NrdR